VFEIRKKKTIPIKQISPKIQLSTFVVLFLHSNVQLAGQLLLYPPFFEPEDTHHITPHIHPKPHPLRIPTSQSPTSPRVPKQNHHKLPPNTHHALIQFFHRRVTDDIRRADCKAETWVGKME
jgi:hypothetical protein